MKPAMNPMVELSRVRVRDLDCKRETMTILQAWPQDIVRSCLRRNPRAETRDHGCRTRMAQIPDPA
jgi:hypothetical protein